jgi:hypothetical protein
VPPHWATDALVLICFGVIAYVAKEAYTWRGSVEQQLLLMVVKQRARRFVLFV